MTNLAVFNFSGSARPAPVKSFIYCEIYVAPFLPQ